MTSDIGIAILIFFIGYVVGVVRRDAYWLDRCHTQQDRGDYWHDKYMFEIDPRWQPRCRKFDVDAEN